jgi:signal transduction histidine kinase
MIKLLRSFYVKLSAVFLILLLALGITQIYLILKSATDLRYEIDQKLNLNLARDFANELKPLLDDEPDFNEIGHRIHYMMVINPKIEIYIADEQGKILAFFAGPGKKIVSDNIDIDPVKEFIRGNFTLPLLGFDPRNPDVKKPFSAASIRLGKERKGFLYIILGGEEYDSAEEMLKNDYLLSTIVQALLFSLTGTGIAGLILFFFMTKRIHGIADTVKQFSNGNFKTRINEKHDDEIGELAASFNNLADTIVEYTEELKNKDSLRRELIANISHDLRTPLASIQGYLETIFIKESKGSLSDEARNKFLRIINKNTELLNKMVYDLFELSKLEARQVEKKPERFSMAELINDITLKFKDRAVKKGIELKFDINADKTIVLADIALMERAISNLVENALEHTQPNGSVTINLLNENDMLRIEVCDTGSGIPEEELPFIFDRFYKNHNNRKGKVGAGLGLAIAFQIINLHKSTLKAKSKLNRGSTFYFDLPLSNN